MFTCSFTRAGVCACSVAPAQTARDRLLFVCWQANSTFNFAFNKRRCSRVDVSAARTQNVVTSLVSFERRRVDLFILSRTSAKFSAVSLYICPFYATFWSSVLFCCEFCPVPQREFDLRRFFSHRLKLLDRHCARRYVFLEGFLHKHTPWHWKRSDCYTSWMSDVATKYSFGVLNTTAQTIVYNDKWMR